MDSITFSSDCFRKYPLKLEKLLKLKYDDPLVDARISCNEPVVIQDSNLVSSASGWDMNSLSAMPGKCTVILSNDHKFMYYDEKKLDAISNFIPSTRRTHMTFSEFAEKVEEWKENDERLYLQQVLDSTVGLNIIQDFTNFNWSWIKQKQSNNNWGPLTSNLIMVSMEGNVTPCHYDEQQNFYAQVKGYKRIILFRPSQFRSLYPYPVHHPYDRQSQIDFDNPDFKRFPNFQDVEGYETIIAPGEVLYIPIYWFHHVESLINCGYTISINFWYKAAPTGQVVYPLKDYQKVAIMRNVEKMLKEALGDPTEIGPLLNTIIDRRYTEL